MALIQSNTAPHAAAARASVLVVDDSVVVRGLFSRWIEADGRFTLLPSAMDGRSAVEAARLHQPRVIVLDLEMPVLDGLSALPEILAVSPNSAVLIASTLTRRNAQISMRCLQLGATEIVPKPDSARDLTLSQSFRDEFIGKVAALSRAKVLPTRPARVEEPVASARHTGEDLSRIVPQIPRYLVIGASTGGPRAVARLIADLKPVLPRLSTLIVQHMPPVFTASFADQLGVTSGLPSREPFHGERMAQGTIYVAPGGRHMGIARDNGHLALQITDGPPVKFCRPSVDVLFKDVAQELGPAALAVVLTGMGSDGQDGAQLLRGQGCAVIAQDEASSVVWGMPGAVVKAGHASAVMAGDQIGPALRDMILRGSISSRGGPSEPRP